MSIDFRINFKTINNNNESLIMSIEKNAFFIEGGGTKGVYAFGVLKYLSEDNPWINLSNVNIFGGTSVGSYLAATLSLGYETTDLIAVSKIIDIAKLFDSKYLFFMTAYRFLSNGYLYDDIGRQQIIESILNYKIDKINDNLGLEQKVTARTLTFGHIQTLINKFPEQYKHLIINTVDISRGEQIFITTLENKWSNIKLFDALLASSAIPYIFKSSEWYYYSSTNSYGYEQLPDSIICSMVDGSVSTNNPTDYFLLNNSKFKDYKLWLLKFTSSSSYVKINGTISLLKQLANYLISKKNDIKTELILEQYKFNTINLHSTAGTFDTYSTIEIQKIIDDIYNKCKTGELCFDNDQ